MRGENQFRGRSDAPNRKSEEEKEKGRLLFINSKQRDTVVSLGLFFLSERSNYGLCSREEVLKHNSAPCHRQPRCAHFKLKV